MIIAPVLLYSDNDFDEIIIADGLKIRKITEEELLKLFGVKIVFENQLPKKIQGAKNNEISFLWSSHIQNPIHGILNKLSPSVSPRIISTLLTPYYLIESENQAMLGDLLFSIRIMGPWNIFCPIGIERIDKGTSHHIFYPNVISVFSKQLVKNRTLAYNDIERLITFFEKIRSNPPGNIKVIKHRLTTIVNESIPKNIRYAEVVGLIESIVSGNHQGELTFKFSLFSSYILSKHGTNTSYEDMEQAYTDRSLILHTGKAKKEITTQRLEQIIEYCQKLIYSSVVEGYTSKKVKEMLLNELGI